MSKKVAVSQGAVAPHAIDGVLTLPTGKPGVPSTSRPRGRPPGPLAPKELPLPEGYQMLRHGRTTFDADLGEAFLEAYYKTGGSLSRACRLTDIKFSKMIEWKETIPELKSAMQEIDAIINDEIHTQFKNRVLTEREMNPAWKIFYIKNHFPQYADKKSTVKITLDLTDNLVKPTVIDAVVTNPLKDEYETGPERPFALPPADTGKIHPGN